MKLFLIRFIVIALFALAFTFLVLKLNFIEAIVLAFVCEYVLEPFLVTKMN